jgi:hypothetical protein
VIGDQRPVMVIGKTDSWRWFEAGTSEEEQTEHVVD